MKKTIPVLMILFLFSTITAQEIFEAVKNSDLILLKKLVSENPQIVDTRDNNGATPLFYAVSNGDKNIVEFLLENNAKHTYVQAEGFCPLGKAIYSGFTEIARLLINNGANVNIRGAGGRTPLYWAAQTNNMEIAKVLIEKKANVTRTNDNGSSPLHAAVYHSNLELIKMLIENGAGLEVTDKKNITPLNLAVSEGKTEVLKLLIEKGVKLNRKDKIHERTEMHLAALTGVRNIMKILIENGSDINAKDKYEHTPLYYASKYGHKNIADLLKTNGASGEDLKENFGINKFLKSEIDTCEAVIWYLGHCGWAVKTRTNLLIFDYWNTGVLPDEPLLANGHINPVEIKDLNVYVFTSHEHKDHFDIQILEWRKFNPNLVYFFGWKYKLFKNYIYVPFNREVSNGDIAVAITQFVDGKAPGHGFLVKTNGLSFYFSGDNVLDTRQMNILKQFTDKFDVLFHIQNGAIMADVVYPTIEFFKPSLICPMHSGGNEYLYKEFAEEVKKQGFGSTIFTPEFRGDMYFYKRK